MTAKEIIGLVGGIISTLVIVAFAIFLAFKDVPQNIVSWIMWTILDALLTVSSYKAGNKRPWLPAGFTIGALLVTIILLTKGVWGWGLAETLSALGIIVALMCWRKLGPKYAVVAVTAAMTLAGIPTLHYAYLNPMADSWWLWGGVSFSCVLTWYGAKGWTIQDRLLPCSSFVFNTAMMVVVLYVK